MRDDLYDHFETGLLNEQEALIGARQRNITDIHLARIAGELCAIGNFLSSKGNFDQAISLQELKVELANLLPRE
jgi:hypothetical protein